VLVKVVELVFDHAGFVAIGKNPGIVKNY